MSDDLFPFLFCCSSLHIPSCLDDPAYIFPACFRCRIRLVPFLTPVSFLIGGLCMPTFSFFGLNL